MARPTTQAALPRHEDDLLEYMKAMPKKAPRQDKLRPQHTKRAISTARAVRRTVSTIAKRHRDLQADFGFGCNVDEHIQFGKCLDGRCMERLDWEVGKLSEGSHHFRDKDLSLHHACQLGNEFAIQHLVHLRPNFNATNDHGQTALHIACRVGPVDVVRCMLAANAVATPPSHRMDLNTQDNDGNTCLHEAAKANQLEITQCLLEAGGRWNVANRDGKLAEHVCGRDQRIFHLLKQHAIAGDLGDELHDLAAKSTSAQRHERIQQRDIASHQLHTRQ
ncbi:hypothetical protein H310_12741 [Aphanomyces invadans]|uniref:Uncharacterized protein n=1 Tax=Aphanomyces invadans TaxID=157072 RepID=A0A024TGJ2_9STRA|nr:hypothetical protein H310_12741 [Aphanomyces invadans]ETV93129.1 hypothetical protein H310_12741 [Aphanomyces invadans]|eukprot:XP_008878151.1 hypothetical protein H310_12741 [Aphanomyces invadans]